MKFLLCLVPIVALALAEPTIWFKESFEDEGWKDRWVVSKKKGSEAGEFKWTAGKFYGDAEKDKGIQTSTDARFYGISAQFTEDFNNEGKTLVIQFTVKHEQDIDCGGGYVKIFPNSLEPEQMHGESPYNIMFGPDICGPGTKKVHVIFNYKGDNLLTKKDIRCKDDVFTHLYTLIVRPDNTYEVKIDNEKVESGKLDEDWDFLKPKEIPDPDAKKPEDWDDRKQIDDPEDSKPEDFDKPQHIPDPDAKKPDDWDDDLDGEWEPPMIDNPDYKGDWKPRQIDNPAYKGEWVHPKIPNPDYEEDDMLYQYSSFQYIGIDVWQVKSGTIFDNVLVTDDEEYAKEVGDETWKKTKEGEKKMKDAQDEEDRKQREEEEKKKKEEEKEKAEEEGEEEEEEEEEAAPGDEAEGGDDEGEAEGGDSVPEAEEEEEEEESAEVKDEL